MELLAENFVFIGFPDIEPTPVYFQAKEDMTGLAVFTTKISWTVKIVNVGDGMDSTTGNFKAPKSGTYFIGLSGVSRFTPGCRCRFTTDVRLLVGGNVAEKAKADVTTFEDQETKETFTLEATLHLIKGDVVTLEIAQDKKNCPSFLGNGEIDLQLNGRLLQEEFHS